MREIYEDIIQKRRDEGREATGQDMICNLMNCSCKDGGAVPDHEIAHMMITLLMAGQHTSSSASPWLVLHLASRADVTQELYKEQLRVLAGVTESEERILAPLQYADLEKLPLLQNVSSSKRCVYIRRFTLSCARQLGQCLSPELTISSR